MKTVRTPKGTLLPLMSLKGKDYLQVAHRIQWFTEEEQKYTITTNFLVLTDDQTVAQVTVSIYNEQGTLVRQATGTKRETKKDFSDHTEKAETGALGRALIELGYGTQYALADLEEGTRIVDSPVVDVKSAVSAANTELPVAASAAPVSANQEGLKKSSSFRKNKPATATTSNVVQAVVSEDDWT